MPPPNDDDLSIVVAAVADERTAAGIATAVERAIRNNSFPPGRQLPTVRRIAEALDVSPATVSVAWTRLRRTGWLDTDRRRGTTVRRRVARPDRPWSAYPLAEHLPDPTLLPTLGAALTAAAASPDHGSDTTSMNAALRRKLVENWPYPPKAMTVTNGGYEGTLLALRATVPPGGVVAVEQPTAPRIIDTLRAVRAVIIPVDVDTEGPQPGSLGEALHRRPDVFLFQPRAQVPTGATMTARRSADLAQVLAHAPSPVTVIEDDNMGPASSAPAHSIGAIHPRRHVLIRSFCKAYGVSIRTCAVSGPTEVIARIERIRSLAMVGTNQMLQTVLAHLLDDVDAELSLRRARRIHQSRRRALAEALTCRGIAVDGSGDGLALWIPVHDERSSHLLLGEHGITAGSGSACNTRAGSAAHIWIGTGSLPDGQAVIDDLADIIAAAASPQSDAHLSAI